MSSPPYDLGRLLFALLLRSHHVSKKLAASIGLPADELYCLAAIHTDQPSCVKELTQILHARGPRTSKILGSLERKGFVRRTLNPEDHRREELALTDRGCHAVESVLAACRDVVDEGPGVTHVQGLKGVTGILERILRVSDLPRRHDRRLGVEGGEGWFILPEGD